MRVPRCVFIFDVVIINKFVNVSLKGENPELLCPEYRN